MHSDGTISVRVNGDHRRVAAGITIAQLASELLGLAQAGLIVERNLEIVPHAMLASARVEDGDELEITHSLGGGAAA